MFKNKVVLITGGSSGIGAATAQKFANEGASVAIVGTNEIKLKAVTDCCMKYGVQALAIKADLRKDEEADTTVKQTIDAFGKLDVLVNNAGILRKNNILSENFLNTFDEVMNVNMRSPARITYYAVPHIIKTKGNIINVSSVAAHCADRLDLIAYKTSKAALSHFSKCCARELAEYGVRVNSISPGPVNTNMLESLSNEDILSVLRNQTALLRVSESEEIADLILYVASDKAKSITGSDYVIDNGRLLV